MTVTGSLVSLCLIYTSFTGSGNDSDRESCLSVSDLHQFHWECDRESCLSVSDLHQFHWEC